MNIINKLSLASTLDNINQIFFENKNLSLPDRNKAASWIASRQGLPGSYWDMFAPTELDYHNGIKLFTGENITSNVGIAHILGEEACRILNLLNIDKSKSTLDRAQNGLRKAIQNAKAKGYEVNGFYCCGKCSAAYWRNLSSELDKYKSNLKAGIKILKSYRDGTGKWKRFPFYYTLLSLYGIDIPEAREELKYASDICERAVNSKRKTGKYGDRRFRLMEKVLEKI